MISAQELPPIQNYSPTDYGAENQNWSISQASDKLIYIANNNGLLEFNGAIWKLYPTPNETIMRSVKAVENRIYTGDYMDFGYWEKDEFGILHYTSLSKEIEIKLLEDEEFWKIIAIDDWILFQSLNRIYIYNTKDRSVEIIESNSKIIKMYKVGNSIYFQKNNLGLFKIENGLDVLVTEHIIVKNNEVVNIFPKESDLLIQTRDNGFYLLNDKKLKKWNISSNDLLSKISVYNSTQLKDQSFLLGTISNGLIKLNNKGDVEFHLNQGNGLMNNTVLSLFEDQDDNIWLGLDIGASLINANSPFKIYNDNNGRIGSVYASAIYDDNLYLGSNQGLFYRDLNSDTEFKLIDGTQGQVWCLKEFEQTLFCGHHLGTFIINDDKAKKISDYQGTWDIKRSKGNSLLIQGNYDGLYILEKKNNTWKVRNKIKNFNNSSRYFVEMPNNEIFINHEYKGVFKVKVDDGFTNALDVSLDSINIGANSCIIEYNGNLLYSYKEGVFKYDNTNKGFEKDSILSKIRDENAEFISGKLVLDDKTNILWGFSSSNISYISPGKLTNAQKIKRIPLTNAKRKGVGGYENILRINDDMGYLFGNYMGYITFDINKLDIKNFQINIHRITNSKNNGNSSSQLINKDVKGAFGSNDNTLEISFYVPEYNKLVETEYQYQLSGMYNEWSDWSKNSVEKFENLPYGDYSFKARAKIGDRISDNIASYSFSIAKPWYATNLIKAMYLLSVLFFLLIMHNVYNKYYKKQRQKLVEKNERILKLAQIENEKEIIRLKNDQLRIDFKSKSKELATSTMVLIKKNELLTTIKKELNVLKEKDLVKPIVNIIDKSLKQNDDWEFFKEAFNNADSEFLKKLKSSHTNLSPNDLKLCAYLRLNLSSKEIAPLLNISSRSVEIKRYRLRKKMNLSHEDNLVDYILKL